MKIQPLSSSDIARGGIEYYANLAYTEWCIHSASRLSKGVTGYQLHVAPLQSGPILWFPTLATARRHARRLGSLVATRFQWPVGTDVEALRKAMPAEVTRLEALNVGL